MRESEAVVGQVDSRAGTQRRCHRDEGIVTTKA
jgi:hypothetical protein